MSKVNRVTTTRGEVGEYIGYNAERAIFIVRFEREGKAPSTEEVPMHSIQAYADYIPVVEIPMPPMPVEQKPTYDELLTQYMRLKARVEELESEIAGLRKISELRKGA